MIHPKTLAEKIWDRHVVRSVEGEPDLLYVDLHLVHEVTSPQAFEGLRLAGREVRRPDLSVATMDHNVPTWGPNRPVEDKVSAKQMEALRNNCEEFGIQLHQWGTIGQGIVHVIGPEMGLTQPGLTIVCGDSHTSTHGAFGCFGVRDRDQRSRARPGDPDSAAATAKDDVRNYRGRSVAGDHGERHHARNLTPHRDQRAASGTSSSIVERLFGTSPWRGRMTVCNMSIEGGARAGLVAHPTRRPSST